MQSSHWLYIGTVRFKKRVRRNCMTCNLRKLQIHVSNDEW